MTISHDSPLWEYLSEQQRVLADDGAFLWADSARHINEEPTDYSYIVFPYAKLFEGFLKQAFLDLGIIRKQEYFSEKYRIGKALSPTLVPRLGDKSAYKLLTKRYGVNLAEELFVTWKEGRNLVFHYFPHNYRSLSRENAGKTIDLLITTMEHFEKIAGLSRYAKKDRSNYVLVAKEDGSSVG